MMPTRNAGPLRCQVEALLQEVREPEQIKPPDGVGEDVGDHVGPGGAQAQECAPGDGGSGCGGLGATVGDVGAFRRGEAGLGLGGVIDERPGDDPDEAERAGDVEGGGPAVVDGQPGDGEGADDGADVAGAVEDAGGEGALLEGEPLADGLDGRREVAAFGQAEAEAGDAEARHRPHQPVRGGGHAPEEGGQRQPALDADPVHQASAAEVAEGVGELERRDDVGVALLGPAQVVRQLRLEDADDLAVHVVDHG